MTSELPPIIAESAAMRRAVQLAHDFAATDLPILLLGPTGCGKELLAQHIHRWSGRRGSPVDINCAALPEQLVESELFGRDAEAYTGARHPKPGLIEVAHGGTLFLDEVGSLPLELQPKLLRVLETGELRRVGETHKRTVDVRVVAAAQEDLLGRIGATFRRDLYQRLAGVVIPILTLAERPEDVVALARHFAGSRGRALEPGAAEVLLNYGWPGNVRELRLVIERAGYAVPDGSLPPEAVAEAIALGAPHRDTVRRPPVRSARGFTRDEAVAALDANGWDVRRAAAALRVGRTTFFMRLRDLGLSLRQEKAARKFNAFTPFS